MATNCSMGLPFFFASAMVWVINSMLSMIDWAGTDLTVPSGFCTAIIESMGPSSERYPITIWSLAKAIIVAPLFA